jgi:hypothetical protein
MVVSAAFGELTEVLECLESSDATVKNVEIGERMMGEQDEITADLTVGVPVLAGVELRDGVSVEAKNFDLQDECVDIELSVTLEVEEVKSGYGAVAARGGSSHEQAGSITVPSYKDPDALRTVYERYDTFPEMTEALGADVTSETVRRYMVEYDIHDPNDTRPQVHRQAAEQAETETATDLRDESSTSDRTNDATTEESSGTSEGDTSEPTNEGAAAVERESPDVTDGENGSGEPESEDSETAERDETSVAELIAATDSGDGDDSLVADGLGIPKDLTVSELATIVNESNTLYEVKQQLGVNQEHARRLLKETALMDLVTQRLGADQIRVSPREIRRRINRGASAPAQ